MRLCAETVTDMTVNDVACFDLDFVLPRPCLCVTKPYYAECMLTIALL